MKPTYRNAAIAAGGAVAVAVASQLLRRRLQRHAAVAQTLTVVLERSAVRNRLTNDATIQRAAQCELIAVDRDEDASVIAWRCEAHPGEGARLALVDAPGGRGTELHLTMRAEKYAVKEIVRRLKSLLETGEIPTASA
jgi:hypothetical protein